jgi:hypothetical protein
MLPPHKKNKVNNTDNVGWSLTPVAAFAITATY